MRTSDIAALVRAQASGDPVAEGALLSRVARAMFAIKRCNQKSALPMPARFFDRLAFGASDCWIWRGHTDEIGYGRIAYAGENKAHRVAWVLFRGEIPGGLRVLHKCDVRQCVNPAHLFLGSQADNVRDMYAKGRNKQSPQPGERNGMARLTNEQAAKIRQMVAAGSKQIEACRRFGVSPMTVSRIVRGKAWK